MKRAQILGDQEDNILEGSIENDTILGLAGNDTLNGSEGNDILQGSSLTAAEEIDILTGETGSDTFVLGTPARVFYDDGNNTTVGVSTFFGRGYRLISTIPLPSLLPRLSADF